jgi:hypothetical protein
MWVDWLSSVGSPIMLLVGLTVCIVAPLTGIRYNPALKPRDEQLRKRGKQKKVAITACTPA